jgi:pyruvate/2-oxoglutarate/acetoin dehydrogenase E1 component/TPP-dependent pyruvate/acetoin dehydrogenase alpha subunit
MLEPTTLSNQKVNKSDFIKEILNDYRLICISREASLLGRKEVLTGKAKFGIFGDGKELAQLVMSKFFKNGDFRSGYYRDQTFMMAIDELTVKQFFAGLYAHTDIEKEPNSGGRQMGGHFSTKTIDKDGNWLNLSNKKNSSSDISCTAAQMPRLVGLGLASKIYRNNKDLKNFEKFSKNGNEVAFGTIGDASTSEGVFWESINAAAVLEVPVVMSVWDDGYGISVPKKYQTTKESISEALSGFEIDNNSNGFKIFKCKGWNYSELFSTYKKAVNFSREHHKPSLVHVEEITQPQGHSTSGSHERYKTKDRLEWEIEFDCVKQFKDWIMSSNNATNHPIADIDTLNEIEQSAKKEVKEQAKLAWKEFLEPNKLLQNECCIHLEKIMINSSEKNELSKILEKLKKIKEPIKKEVFSSFRKTLIITRKEKNAAKVAAIEWFKKQQEIQFGNYNSNLYTENSSLSQNTNVVNPIPSDSNVDGRIILRNNFKKLFEQYPELLTFGEDTGIIGGVNQVMEGLQEEFGEIRVFDTGIRETTIIGQGIGLALRGLRPIAEIQYLDYLLYCIQIMSDDLATLSYRTKGTQKCPLIIRTRGHRLEGIWHAGSPLGGIINLLKGIVVCVPRNMTKAAGFYNTLMKSDDPALVIECLNGYRIKENEPSNYGEFTTPIGIPEIVKKGNDVTVVSYGSTFNLCIEASKELEQLNISCELIDVQTLIPFDVNKEIVKSLSKTNKIIFIDEDVPGGATAYMMDQVINKQKGYFHLDSQPVTLSAKDHRPAYGTDGDYFSKPSINDIVEAIYAIMSENNPSNFPRII